MCADLYTYRTTAFGNSIKLLMRKIVNSYREKEVWTFELGYVKLSQWGPSISLSLCLCLYVCLSVCLSVCLAVWLAVCLSVSLTHAQPSVLSLVVSL